MKSKTQTEHMIELKSKVEKKKKIRLLVCGKKTFNPKNQVCICLGNRRCIVVKKRKNKKDRKSDKQKLIEKRQNQTINYLRENPQRTNRAFELRTDNYSYNVRRTNAETLLHRILRDRFIIEPKDQETYLDYLRQLRSGESVLNPNIEPSRIIPNTELERELSEEIETAEELQPIVNNNRERPQPLNLLDRNDDIEEYNRLQEVEEISRDINRPPIYRNQYDPNAPITTRIAPRSIRNIRLEREARNNQQVKEDNNTRLRLSESNINRLQRRLRGDNKINYSVDNDNISITESELGKLGIVPSIKSEEATDDIDSVISMTKDEILDLI